MQRCTASAAGGTASGCSRPGQWSGRGPGRRGRQGTSQPPSRPRPREERDLSTKKHAPGPPRCPHPEGWGRSYAARVDRPARLSATELIDLVLDEGSWTSWDVTPVRGEVDTAYAAELDAAQERSGADESVLTGEGLMRGRRVAVLMGEFLFLAGSIGRAAADRLVARSSGRPGRGCRCSRGRCRRDAHAGGHARFRADGADLQAVAAHRKAGLRTWSTSGTRPPAA